MAIGKETKNDILKTETFSAIETEELSIGYQTKKETIVIARDIQFSIQKGELVAIVGSNGIGKSTLLRTLAKIQPALSGKIQINGKPLIDFGALDLAKVISLVLTEPIVSKNMSVSEIIALGRQPYTNWMGSLSADDIAKVKEIIKIVALEDIAYKKCFEISDGQLQLVMVARALAQDTETILLDEPTTHLDLHHKVQILKLLKRIAIETHKTILFTSHEIELAIQLCDKMLLMNTGSYYFGTPNKLIELGAFDHLFPPDMVTFNSETRTFQING